jgi:RNA 2',3'-cyclic 3'-phosphodiesterase
VPPTERARVFFALWPDSVLQGALAACAREAQAECGGRAVVRENIHLTLYFVGSFERARLHALEELAASLVARSFTLEFPRLRYWRRQRLVWAGAAHCPPALAHLVSSLNAALESERLPREERSYVPHITLVRNAERRPQRAAIAPLTWDVRDFVLVESHTLAGGVRYEVIGRWPLAAAAA